MRTSVITLLLALGTWLGFAGNAEAGTAVVQLIPETATVPPGSGFEVQFLVTTSTPIQAFDLEVAISNTTVALPVKADPHPDFDDDGKLFMVPKWSQTKKAIVDIVDLRHGSEGATGSVILARVPMRALSAGQVMLKPSGKILDANGQELTILLWEPSVVQVTPLP